MNKKIVMPFFIFFAGLIIGGAGFYLFQDQIQGQKSLSLEQAGEVAMDFINKAIQKENANVTASLINSAEESGVYKIHLKIEENEYDSFISKDGKYLFSVAFNLEEERANKTNETNEIGETQQNQETQATQVSPDASSLENLANCLTEKGAKFYGASWCGHCQNQKKMFGEFAELLPYIECSTPDGGAQTAVCQENNITGYPTWVFADGSRESGEVSLQKLAEKTGCQLAQ